MSVFPVSYNPLLTRAIGERMRYNTNLNLIKEFSPWNHGLICENYNHNGNMYWILYLTNTEQLFIPKEELYHETVSHIIIFIGLILWTQTPLKDIRNEVMLQGDIKCPLEFRPIHSYQVSINKSVSHTSSVMMSLKRNGSRTWKAKKWNEDTNYRSSHRVQVS